MERSKERKDGTHFSNTNGNIYYDNMSQERKITKYCERGLLLQEVCKTNTCKIKCLFFLFPPTPRNTRACKVKELRKEENKERNKETNK